MLKLQHQYQLFNSRGSTFTLINNFSKITSLNDVFNYDPVANNNVNVQAVSSQITNLMINSSLNEVSDSTKY